jgi:hypothetical protein
VQNAQREERSFRFAVKAAFAVSVAGLVAVLWLPAPSLAVSQLQGAEGVLQVEPEAPAAAAESHAGAESGEADTVKGWLHARPGGSLEDLPHGSRIAESYDDRLFVELPAEAMRGLEKRGLAFLPVPDADILSVGPRRFDVRAGEPPVDPEWRAAPPGAEGRRPYLIKFDVPVKPEWLDEIRSAGAEIVQYQSQFGYLLLVPPGIENRLRRATQVAFTGEYHPAFKANPSLIARAAHEESITLRVVYFDLPGYEEKIDGVLARGAKLGHLSEGASTSQWALLHYAIYEEVRTRDLPAILREPHVYWAEEWFPPELEGERAAQITADNISIGQPVTGYNAWLTSLGTEGAGVTVAVADTGLDTGVAGTIHEDFTGRVSFATALCSTNRDRNGHGTNVASAAVGDPRSPTGTGLTDAGGFYWGMGAAPGASLYFQKALDSFDCGVSYGANANTLAQDAVGNGGAQIGTHSFTDGLGGGSSYNSQAQAWDARVRDADTGTAGNQPYAVLFSSGNSGPSASSLTSPKAAKNIITVGATENYRPGQCPGISGCGGEADDVDALVGFSSRGPTTDGRIKPDVSAPGHVIAGALSSLAVYDCYCDGGGSGCCASTGIDGSSKYTVYSGTSQAVPRVAGASALVFAWFDDRFGAFPSPAMNKAILINGATDMKTLDVPNSNEGWGRVNLAGSLLAPAAAAYVDQNTIIGTTGDPGAFTATYYIQDPTLPSKATLVWTEPPASIGCSPCLVNDLDLLVTQGTTWYGNNFTNGFSDTGTTPDTLNNIEGIHLPAGTLTCSSFDVKVRAQSLNGDGVPGNGDATDQDFALVVSNAATTPGPPILDVSASAVSGGCDDDGFLDRRETADLTLDLSNAGCAGATGVEATLSVESQPSGANVIVFPTGPQSIGSIGVSGTVQQGWQISLADNASSFCGETVTLRVDITDGGSGSWVEFVEVILDTDAFTPTTLTDPADTDNSFSKDADWTLQSCRTTSTPTSWHMGQTDCTGIPKDGTTRELIFAYTVSSTDIIKELSFQHAFTGYRNSDYSLTDTVQVDIDPEDDGSFVTLQSWRQGIDNPTSMTLAGPYDLTPFNATRGNTIKVRFLFTSAASWIGPNSAAGWDVDDITFEYDTITCDPNSCPACSDPSGLTNNTATDALDCLRSGNEVSWAQDAGDWGDGGSGVRSYVVVRDGTPLASGGCGGSHAYGTTSCIDDTTSPGFNHNYKVRYANGCGGEAETTGASSIDRNIAPPPVNDGASGGNPVTITMSGGNITMTWDPGICALRYNLYMGTIGTYWSHAKFSAAGLDGADACAEPTNAVTFVDPGGSIYFLVAAKNEFRESNLGVSTVQNPRPYAVPACSPH